MSNSVTNQTLIDGQRATVIKFEGVLDTSNIAAAGTLGAGADGGTTIGSTAITFTASTGLNPNPGQYITGTGIPSTTYLVSVNYAAGTGVLSKAATATGTTVTFSLVSGAIVVADPAILQTILNNNRTATGFRVNKIIHNIEDGLTVNLFWEATANQRIEALAGRGQPDYNKFGGLVPNPGAGATGRIVATSTGWTTGAIISFSLVLELIKM